MSNNPILYNAALTGAVGGLSAERWPKSTDASDYVGLRNTCVEFAVAMDAAIVAGDYSQQDADLLESLCENLLSHRGSAGSLTGLASVIGAMFALLQAQIEPVSPDAGLTRLSNVRYADVATVVPEADRDGNIETPFAELHIAIASLPAEGGTVYLAPGSYGGSEVPIVIDCPELSIVGMTADYDDCVLPNIIFGDGQKLVLQNVSVNSVVGGVIETQNAFINALVVNSAAEIGAGSVLNTLSMVSFAGAANINRAEVAALYPYPGSTIRANYSTISSIIQGGAFTSDVSLSWCKLAGSVDAADAALVMQNCEVANAITIATDSLVIDNATYQKGLKASVTFTIADGVVINDIPTFVGNLAYVPVTSTPASFTLLPAGHKPGMYSISQFIYSTNSPAATANISTALTWRVPGGTPVSLPLATITATIGVKTANSASIISDGTAAVIVTLNPGSVGAVWTLLVGYNATLIAAF